MGTRTEIYATFVMTIVSEEDMTRIIWPSSPSSNGWKTGVNTLDGRPNGNALTTDETDGAHNSSFHVLEIHGPYWHGWSQTHPAVNGPLNQTIFEKDIFPPSFHEDIQVGPEFSNTFVSKRVWW